MGIGLEDVLQLTYVDVLKKDAGAQSTNELARCMENRDDRKQRWKGSSEDDLERTAIKAAIKHHCTVEILITQTSDRV
ncbi:Hypothetical predicted protein [Scomber scombrus]|uniref:Uncharacterized protein n=1 Tax=Scomber scombrus TaxID=13677 RepID=A0AAV1P587_SCOSC